MKKGIAIFLSAFCICNFSLAQTNVYHPFPDSSAEWRDVNYQPGDYYPLPNWVFDYRRFFNGDTLIGINTYHKLFEESTCSIDSPSNHSFHIIQYIPSHYIGGLREDSLRRIYFFPDTATIEYLLYDFGNLSIGAFLSPTLTNLFATHFISSIDSVLIDGSYRKCYAVDDSLLNCDSPYPIALLIEGVGSTNGLLGNSECHFEARGDYLMCFKENGQLLYDYPIDIYHYCSSIWATSENLNSQSEISISPNPFHTTTALEITNKNIENAELKIYNALGSLVFHSTIFNQHSTINRGSLSDGLYFYELRTNNYELVGNGKFVIE